MPYNRIEYMGASAVAHEEGRLDTIVISIRGSRSEPARIQPGFRDVLYLEFDNVESLSSRYLRFSRAQAEEILAFVAKHEAEASRILINCMAGESRSAAVACYLSEAYQVPLQAIPDNPLRWVIHVMHRTVQFSKLRAQPGHPPLPPAVCPR